MKKLVLSLVVVLALMVASCGPTAKELNDKRIADSIKVADSIAFVQVQQKLVADSIEKVDSIKKADSIAKLPKVKGKKGFKEKVR
jgi:hypothetical protein